ncbi:MAG: AMP-binding protein [Elusimicrobia bacterium]|nr:AMP-binding protein [Elusimicrobiota bacterium]
MGKRQDTLSGLLLRGARSKGSQPYLIHASTGSVCTYQEACAAAERAAAGLEAQGAGRGARVAFVLEDDLQVVVSLLACARLGACASFLDPGLPEPRVSAGLKVFRPRLVVRSRDVRAMLRVPGTRSPGPTAPARAEDPLVSFLGEGRSAVHTQSSLLAGAEALAERFKPLGAGAEWCLWPGRAYPALLDAVCALLRGGSLVLGGASLLKTSAGPALERLRVRALDLPASMLTLLLRKTMGSGSPAFPEGVRWVRCSGGPFPEREARAFESSSGVPVVALLSAAESGPVSSTQARLGARPPGCVGRPLHGCDVRILDSRGRAKPPGRSGEVAVRSKAVMTGRVPTGGSVRLDPRRRWRRTGLQGRLDRKGDLHLPAT